VIDMSRTGWFYRDARPPNDNAIFENLTRVIFQGGLSWDLIESKWPAFREAFVDFSFEDVAQFTENDIAELLENEKIIRNSKKIEATVYNAQEFLKIKENHGSFLNYLDSLDKSNNYKEVIKILSKQFKRLGVKTSYIFLYSIAEDIKWDLPEEPKKHKS
jgi:DNA-3-methyladenine glycosylase I